MVWEIDWGNKKNTGTKVIARNIQSDFKSAREWHLVATGFLRSLGVSVPTYRADSWEVDWQQRNGKLVWARNPCSKIESARAWHWVDFHTLERQGIKWKPIKEKTGKSIDYYGYVLLTKSMMTDEDIELCEKYNLFRGSKKAFVKEHRLVALKKYGYVPEVVRHINGVQHDNAPGNLIAGTTQENTADHNKARLSAMMWREKYENAQLEIVELKRRLSS